MLFQINSSTDLENATAQCPSVCSAKNCQVILRIPSLPTAKADTVSFEPQNVVFVFNRHSSLTDNTEYGVQRIMKALTDVQGWSVEAFQMKCDEHTAELERIFNQTTERVHSLFMAFLKSSLCSFEICLEPSQNSQLSSDSELSLDWDTPIIHQLYTQTRDLWHDCTLRNDFWKHETRDPKVIRTRDLFQGERFPNLRDIALDALVISDQQLNELVISLSYMKLHTVQLNGLCLDTLKSWGKLREVDFLETLVVRVPEVEEGKVCFRTDCDPCLEWPEDEAYNQGEEEGAYSAGKLSTVYDWISHIHLKTQP